MRVVLPPVLVRRVLLLLFLLLLCFLKASSSSNLPPPDFPKVSKIVDGLAQAVHVLREGQKHPVPRIQLAIEYALAQVEGQLVNKRGEWENLEQRAEADDDTDNDEQQQQQQHVAKAAMRDVPLLRGMGKSLWEVGQQLSLPSAEADARLQALLIKVEEGAEEWMRGSEGISKIFHPAVPKVTRVAGMTIADLFNFSPSTWPLGASSSPSSSSSSFPPPAFKNDREGDERENAGGGEKEEEEEDEKGGVSWVQKVQEAWQVLQRLLRGLFIGFGLFVFVYLFQDGLTTGKERKMEMEKEVQSEEEKEKLEGGKKGDKEEEEGEEGEKEKEGGKEDEEKEEEGREGGEPWTPVEEICERPPVPVSSSMLAGGQTNDEKEDEEEGGVKEEGQIKRGRDVREEEEGEKSDDEEEEEGEEEKTKVTKQAEEEENEVEEEDNKSGMMMTEELPPTTNTSSLTITNNATIGAFLPPVLPSCVWRCCC